MFNFKQFKQLVLNMESAYEDFDDFLLSFLTENANWIVGEVKERTPVDTGYLRRRWRVSKVYRLSTGTLAFVLINDADYASYVEYGHTTRNRDKWVDGYYMCAISIDKLEKALPRRFERELNDFFRKHGV